MSPGAWEGARRLGIGICRGDLLLLAHSGPGEGNSAPPCDGPLAGRLIDKPYAPVNRIPSARTCPSAAATRSEGLAE